MEKACCAARPGRESGRVAGPAQPAERKQRRVQRLAHSSLSPAPLPFLFAAEAQGPAASAATVAAAARRLSAQLLPELSRLRWENTAKEAFWLLALDGVHVGARAAHQALPCVPCGGNALAGRAHLFWECPPALAVRGALQQELARRGCAVVLERRG